MCIGTKAMLRLLKRFSCDQSAVSTIEFAIIGPAFLAMLIGIFQVALVFLANDGLETVAENAGRILMTGQAQKSGMSAANFKTAACKVLPPFLSCNHLMVDVQTANAYSKADLSVPTLTYNKKGNVDNSFSFNTGRQGDIVVIRVMYLFPVLPAPLGFNLANQPGSKRLLVATSVLRSEFY